MSDLRRILQRSETSDRLVVILLWVMALALIILLPSTLSHSNAQSATESQTESDQQSTLVDGEQTIVPLESTSGSNVHGNAKNRTSIKINTSLPAELTFNGEEISLPADGDVDDSVMTDTGGVLNFSINSNLTGGDDLDIDIESKSKIDIDNDIKETFEVNN